MTKYIIKGPRLVTASSAEFFPRYLDMALRFETKSTINAVGQLANKLMVYSANKQDGGALAIAGERFGLFAAEEEFEPALLWKRIAAVVELAGGVV